LEGESAFLERRLVRFALDLQVGGDAERVPDGLLVRAALRGPLQVNPPRAGGAYCLEEWDCPFGDSVDQVMQGLRTFLSSVDQSPLPRTGDNAVPRLTEGWASLGIAAAMYDQGAWQTLVDAMRDAVGGDGTALMQLADQYADRNPGGQYAGNIMEVIYAVNCRGTVRGNGEDLQVLEEKPDMQYNYNMGGEKLRHGRNTVTIDYTPLVDAGRSMKPKLKVRIS